jgi:hypothetical protein
MKHGEKGTRLATCAIATCSPNELMAKIHDRMPVILPVGARDRWLDPTAGVAELRGLLVPLPAEDLNAYEVSAPVNSPANDSPECVRPGVAGYGQFGGKPSSASWSSAHWSRTTSSASALGTSHDRGADEFRQARC